MVRRFPFVAGGRGETASPGVQANYSHWIRYNTFYGLVFTTALATTLLLAELNQWRVTGYFFQLANKFPGSVALVVQLLAAFFGLIHVAVICKLINYALRLRLSKASVSLDILRTWYNMSIARVDWDLPLRFFFPVLFVVFLSLVPAALWAGSITPSIARTTGVGSLLIPSYEDVSLIREYPMMIGMAGPSLRTQKGYFTYSVGQQHSGQLLSSAASASSTSAGAFLHPKIDNTQFNYKGRSYGVGAPAGLMDSTMSSNSQIAGYNYQERGYLTNCTCIYNDTSQFVLSGPVNEWIYAASGNLPDSTDGPEYSNYIGHDGNAIVAIGVSFSRRSPRRYLAITAGESYSFLNGTQCEFDFTPTLFNVTVDLANLNITVRPIQRIRDFNLERNLTRTVVRQFELMSNDLTNLYVSLLGEALNSSIAAYNMSRTPSEMQRLTEQEVTLAGLRNSILAMADDMLVAYGSAQLMVGTMFTQQQARVYIYALQFGQPSYIYAIFALNLLIILAVLLEAVRTHGWSALSRFNYLDPRDLIIAASRGGVEVAEAADSLMQNDHRKRMKHVWLLSDPDEGNGALVVKMHTDELGRVTLAMEPDRPPKLERELSVEDADSERVSSYYFTGDEKGADFGALHREVVGVVPKSPRSPMPIPPRKWPKQRRIGIFGSVSD